MSTTVTRYHDISVGHRVVGHEGKCQYLHGHNYRIHFTVEALALDKVGRVLDFGIIKELLCQWLEDNWDHKFLAWADDNLLNKALSGNADTLLMLANSIVWVPFNPTAENMAEYLVEEIGPIALQGTYCTLVGVTIEETRKCSCNYTKDSK